MSASVLTAPSAAARGSRELPATARALPSRAAARGRRVALAAWCLTGLGAAAAAAAYRAGYRLNLTPSVPVGLWRLTAGAVPRRGEVALWCPPDAPVFRTARSRGYLPRGGCPGGYVPLFKPVAALAGDLVTVTPAAIAVNGVPLPRTGQMVLDGTGRTLPRVAPGTYRVRPGEVWFVSSYNGRSFDARYYGPMPAARIQGVLRPVLTRGYTE